MYAPHSVPRLIHAQAAGMWKTTSRSANRSAQRKYRATAAARSPAAPAEACPRRVSSAPRPVSRATASSRSVSSSAAPSWHYPGRKPPFFAVKRPAHPYKTTIEK